MQSLCNHNYLLARIVADLLQKTLFYLKSTPTQNAEIPQLVEQNPCQSALSPTFRIRNIQRKKSQKTLRLSL